jgi:lipopolysaccharide/colanic/teichoic acid biosynthesis glycosyltransferase
MSIVEEIRLVLTYSFFWFFVYIGFVYLSTGFIFKNEIPRLIILYAYVISTVFSVIIRYTIYTIYSILSKNGVIQKEIILIIGESPEWLPQDISDTHIIYLRYDQKEEIEDLIRSGTLHKIISIGDPSEASSVFALARVYGVLFCYPKVSPIWAGCVSREGWIGDMPLIEITPVAITAWWRIAKRSFDIIGSSFWLVFLSPILLIVGLWVYLSDPSGPIIYRNRRIGQDGRIFALYKFRYMYWRYCTKEDYGIIDNALAYEEELKKSKNTREWPLYKIEDDPRRMWWGRFIERLSLDELPQLWNVLRWDMSLIWPRPHQPREIELYRESDRQVLTVKPGITGMAQVYGRDTNSFDTEITLDTYYIEHYSISLDMAILLRTIFVVIGRIWK